MKIFIAYILVVIGIPFFIGQLFGVIFSMPISLIVGLSRRGTETPLEAAEAMSKDPQAWMSPGNPKIALRDRIAHANLDVCNGFGAILAAWLLFHFMGLPLGVAVLLILAAWEIIANVTSGFSFRVLFFSLAGLIVGWFVVKS